MRPFLTLLSCIFPLKLFKKEHTDLYTLCPHTREHNHMCRYLRWELSFSESWIIQMERSLEIIQFNLLFKAGLASKSYHVAQSFFQSSFEYLQEWRFNSLPEICCSIRPFRQLIPHRPTLLLFSIGISLFAAYDCCPLSSHCALLWGAWHHLLPNTPQVLEDSNYKLSESFSKVKSSSIKPLRALLALPQPAPTLPMGLKTSFHLCQRLLVPTSAMSQRSPTLPPEQTSDAHCSLVSNPVLGSGSSCSCWPLWVVPGLGSSPCRAWAVNGSHYQHPALPDPLRHCGAHQWRTTTSVGVTSTPSVAPSQSSPTLAAS